MPPSEDTTSGGKDGQSIPDHERPPLPPRPSDPNVLMHDSLSPTGRSSHPKPRATLVSGATTALSMTDVSTSSRADGSRALRTSTPSRAPSSSTVDRVGSGKTSDMGDDSTSILSYAPMKASQETESIFDDGLADKAVTWTFGDQSEVTRDQTDVDFETEFDDVQAHGASEETATASWKAKKKHFIILSAAGKPIYTRHGSDSMISSYVGILQTIISSYQSSQDSIRSVVAGNTRFVVLSQTNLFLVAISKLNESDVQLQVQLDALYMQILSTLTLPTLTHIFSVRPSSDLRRPLQGTEVLLSSLADTFTRGSPSTLLSALECLKMRKSQRQVINNTFLKARVDDLLYGLIAAGGRLVSVIRPKKHSLHPSDLQLLFNMLFEAEGIQAGGGDSWIPVCLPGFNKTGYLYMYVSYLNITDTNNIREVDRHEKIAKDDAAAIILLSANKESFEALRRMKSYLVHELHRTNSMQAIQTAVQLGRPAPTDVIPGTILRHFLYKSKSNVQFFMPSYTPYFASLNQRRQLLSLYHALHASVHARHAPVKVHHSVTPSAASLAWITPLFELYAVASAQQTRNALAQAANRVVQWVAREEERIFLIGGAVF